MLHVTSEPLTGSSAIAPDTRGWNFFEADQTLKDLLSIYLEPRLLAHMQPWLHRLGHMAANELDEAAAFADKHPPVLHPRDRFGNDLQTIEYHPAYHQLEKAAYEIFGIHAMSHKPGVMDWPTPYPAVAKHALTFLFNQVEFGLGCPINVTDSGAHVLKLFGDDALKQRYLPRMLAQNLDTLWQGAQFMTEKEGGSDVGRLTTVARRDGDCWRITGEKWFCSNADGKAVLLLARPEGAAQGTRGLGLFLMPRFLEDGTPNSYRIVRLKDKLGTRSMASGECALDGALAYQVGSLERGFVQMAEMVNWSRLSNGVKSSALMRRACHDARAVMDGRTVFGMKLIDKPLARRQMMKILLPSEQSMSMWCFTAAALDEAEGYGDRAPSQEAAAVLRLATPVMKFRITREARMQTGDALEMRGGIGYVEDFVSPRLLRDAHLGSVWEGTSNIVALDAVTRAVRRHRCHEPYAAAVRARLEEATDLPVDFRESLSDYFNRAVAMVTRFAEQPEHEAGYRQACTNLYHATSAILMAWEANRIHALRGDARRLLFAKAVLDHRLAARDPFAPIDPASEERASYLLLRSVPVGMDEVRSLLA